MRSSSVNARFRALHGGKSPRSGVCAASSRRRPRDGAASRNARARSRAARSRSELHFASSSRRGDERSSVVEKNAILAENRAGRLCDFRVINAQIGCVQHTGSEPRELACSTTRTSGRGSLAVGGSLAVEGRAARVAERCGSGTRIGRHRQSLGGRDDDSRATHRARADVPSPRTPKQGMIAGRFAGRAGTFRRLGGESPVALPRGTASVDPAPRFTRRTKKAGRE
jgi:hypothetical protein